jgi:peptidoglycan/LPS O-acetylase OafA/YrhL
LSKRIPSLDGLRAVSIVAVILGHVAACKALPFNPRVLSFLERIPSMGVRVFFVLSGFLITTLILEEREKTARFSLSNFYMRRAWRILPPAYTLLFCLIVADILRWISISPIDYLRGFTYFMNYGPIPKWYVGHLWSLSVEEQFYLIWPFLLAFLPTKTCRSIAAAFIVVSAVLRYHMVAQGSPDQWYLEYQFQYAATAIAFGCLLAIDRKWLYAQPWFRKVCASPITFVVPCAVLLANTKLHASGALGESAKDIVANVCILVLVAKFTCQPFGFVAKILNSRPFVAVGLISYSLYLWQQEFSNPNVHNWSQRFPYNLLMIVGCALGSYFLVEKPTQRMRKSLAEAIPRQKPYEAEARA